MIKLGVCCTLLAIAQATDQDDSLSTGERWGFGILAGFGLSAFGFVAAFILVLIGKKIQTDTFKDCIRVLFSLACGTLIGDAVIHILSEAYRSQITNQYIVSLIFIGALLLFMLLEKVMVRCGISHNHWVDEEGHEHHHHGQAYQQLNPEVKDISKSVEAEEPLAKKKEPGCMERWRGKGSAGYLNLLGSFIHNFVDGLSTGLVFAIGNRHVITATVIAIFSHEVPRQLGDVAILLENRFSGCQAIVSNGVINFMSLVGVVVGLCTLGVPESIQDYIMVFVAGNFMYIAADIWRNLFQGSWKLNLLELLFFCGGVASMFGIKFLEDDS